MQRVVQDLDMFPGCSDVVRVGTPRWDASHDDVLERLLHKFRTWLEAYPGNSFPAMYQQFEQNDMRVRVRDQFAHVLYGPNPLSLSPEGELQMDIKGLVFWPRVRKAKGRLSVEFGPEESQ